MNKFTTPLSTAELAAYQAHLKELQTKLQELSEACASFKEFCQNPQMHFTKYYFAKLEKKVRVWEGMVEDLKYIFP